MIVYVLLTLLWLNGVAAPEAAQPALLAPYALAFIASFVFVALKSWQQLNVVRRAYRWILPTSMCMALCEVYVIASVASQGVGWLVVWVGLGGGLGSTFATWLHWRLVKR